MCHLTRPPHTRLCVPSSWRHDELKPYSNILILGIEGGPRGSTSELYHGFHDVHGGPVL